MLCTIKLHILKLTFVGRNNYNIGSQDCKVGSFDEWHETLDAIVEVVIAQPEGVVPHHVGERKKRLVLED
jgi:hypothetical protein